MLFLSVSDAQESQEGSGCSCQGCTMVSSNCNGTFETLKKNMPLVMQSVQLNTIRLWDHRMHAAGWRHIRQL
ncbi:hypothetical protein BDR04DRAFT_117971 [Suillus decipiens]|nr:hypothetical protein BDR04DRAFT_117971 [Suillus decipiens]